MRNKLSKKVLAVVLAAAFVTSMGVLAGAAETEAPAKEAPAATETVETTPEAATETEAAAETAVATSATVDASTATPADPGAGVEAAPEAAPAEPVIPGYCVKFEDGKAVVLKDGVKVATYEMRSTNMSIKTDAKGEVIMGFIDASGKTRAISLGVQKTIAFDGKAENVTIEKGTSKELTATFAPTSAVTNVVVNNASTVSIQGKVLYTEVNGPAKVEVPEGGQVASFKATTGHARLSVQESAAVGSVSGTSSSLMSGTQATVPVIKVESSSDSAALKVEDDKKPSSSTTVQPTPGYCTNK